MQRSDAFADSLAPYRREMLVHCYRMVGSLDEAEDLVQETMLRAWQARGRYDERVASLRTWLYKIATNACLTWLKGRARRVLPTGHVPISDDPQAPLSPAYDVPWLQPLPSAGSADPAAEVVQRSSVRLALVAAMQLLPPRQRAVFVLREVLDYPAAQAADLLGTSVAAVNSALQRARATVSATALEESAIGEPDDTEVRQIVDKYARAFEVADVDGLVALLTEDAVLEMPPVPLWYRGRADYGRFMARAYALRGPDWRVLTTEANGQPALAAYVRDGDAYRLHSVQVLAVTAAGIARNTVFADPRVFPAFPFPLSFPPEVQPAR